MANQNYTDLTNAEFRAKHNLNSKANNGVNQINSSRPLVKNNYFTPDDHYLEQQHEPDLFPDYNSYQPPKTPQRTEKKEKDPGSVNRGRPKTGGGASPFIANKAQSQSTATTTHKGPHSDAKNNDKAKKATNLVNAYSPNKNMGLYANPTHSEPTHSKITKSPNGNIDIQDLTKEEVMQWKAQTEEDLHIMSQKHESLIGVILAEEEEVIGLHRQHIDDMVELVKQVKFCMGI